MGFRYDRASGERLHGGVAILFFETQKTAGTLPKDQFSFKTILGASEGHYREKGSRFLGFAFPVSTETEIRDHLSRLQKKYFDARHHCYAWRLGPAGTLFRAHDAGEPNHSAGDPILGQIRSKDLTDVLVVVVRYFGGVKLGVGGLITAYRSAAEDTLNHAEIVEKEVMKVITVLYDYANTPDVMRLVKEFDWQIRSQNFESGCELVARYKLKDERALLEKLALMKAMGANIRYEMTG